MNLIKTYIQQYRARKKIKNELLDMVKTHIDLKNKKITDIQKSDLDSIELMVLLQHIEQKWGKISLAELYQAKTFDDIVLLIQRKAQ